ncbi:probable LRR receptor-like serine threonine-kinase At3g47570 [Olea europaea subsp. europaea]|uniref:Probable LRR receptor-like serine threonine-kinase At3g47570 n=1 Tax=Olea europaea subsp. europaea TaxID=158383 RepID=A0A8S0TDI6_OLEEU|nr:probable LRR receptor-like serine threonine-kinase At3g47570 [Olea europaea subsp. europaea]
MDISLYNVAGELPAELGKLNLEEFNIYNNSFFGPIPYSVFNISTIKRMALSFNQFSGHLPSTMGLSVPNLEELHLVQNKLSGVIPSSITNSSKLNFLFLGSNSFSGIMPNFVNLWNLKDLLKLNLSYNSFRGSLPLEIKNLKVVNEVDLSWNQFTADIPSSIGSMQSLMSISFAHNKFQGSIPLSLRNIISLESLDVSYNSISGVIPTSLEALNYLRYFDVSHNRLEGEIPLGGRFTNFTAQSFMQNYDLCSKTRNQFPHCKETLKWTRSKIGKSLVKYIIPPIIAVILAAPSNVMLDQDMVAHVDFGIARLFSEWESEV